MDFSPITHAEQARAVKAGASQEAKDRRQCGTIEPVKTSDASCASP
jgi:hypothetical protein